jgi:transposase
MSKGKRYTKEFKIEAVKQVTDRGYSVNEVAERLGITLNRCTTGVAS